MILNEGLRDDDPVAYAFIDTLTLGEEQLDELESMIDEAGYSLEGARQWAQNNRDVWQLWVEAVWRTRNCSGKGLSH
jgi:glycine betaine/proline transport system substrate-binding protein